MKKKEICILLMVLFSLNNLVYSKDISSQIKVNNEVKNIVAQPEIKNQLQQEYESSQFATFKNIDNYYLLKQDYNYYTTTGGSVIGTFVKKSEDLKSNEANYYNQMVNNILGAIEDQSVTIKPIIVEDTTYKTLSENLKKDLAMYNNVFADSPIDILLYQDDSFNLQDIKNEKENAKKLPKAEHSKGEKIGYGIYTAITSPINIVDNALNGNFHRMWEDKHMRVNYNELVESKRIAIEKKNKEISKKETNTKKILYLRAFENRAYNTALMDANQQFTLGNTDYTGNKLLEQIKATDEQVEKLYKDYKTKPNDIKRNAELIKIMGTSKGEYTSLLKYIEKNNLSEAYKTYVDSYNSQKYRANILNIEDLAFDDSEDNQVLLNQENFNLRLYDDSSLIQAHDQMIDIINKYDNYAKDVSTYSYNYEKQKYNNWALKNHKKQISGSLEQFVYASHYEPKSGAIYSHNPTENMFLKVIQTVPGGVILSGTYIGNGIYGTNNIFLQTSKSFADGQYINQPLLAEFKGYYDYTTVLGVKKRIYKFYRLGQSEIDANFKIPNQPLYFYKPY